MAEGKKGKSKKVKEKRKKVGNKKRYCIGSQSQSSSLRVTVSVIESKFTLGPIVLSILLHFTVVP
jgi:hypothetical protein